MDTGLDHLQARSKQLPPLGFSKDDELPLPPPPISPISSDPRPSPPPKTMYEGGMGNPPIYSRDDRPPPSPQTDLPNPSFLTSPPGSPAFPGSGPVAADARPKKVNPFVDLMETEKSYVDTLSGIIRKVAAAWSRSNLPPPELDTMFRSIEGVYKANRSFQAKLKEIGPNPSSPRAIGDLLMGWIDQLDVPYMRYCTSFVMGYDEWEPVQSNQRLPGVLEAFSETNPPPHSPLWTLDTLFSLPNARIKYYLKLYGRLLKNSTPGKSTDKKLIEAVAKLEELLSVIEDRRSVRLPGPTETFESHDEVVIDTRALEDDVKQMSLENSHGRGGSEATARLDIRDSGGSLTSSGLGSSSSSAFRSSRDTAFTSEGRESFSSTPLSMADLEKSLATERCRDLFTMQSRSVKLSIDSPNLPFTRELKLSEDAEIHFTPQNTGAGVIHRRGHIYLLTDLFLVCERMTADERSRSHVQDMWLCYPPLAVKHTHPEAVGDVSIEITILKKERMLLHFDSPLRRDDILRTFRSVVATATTLAPQSKTAPPPVPALPNAGQGGPSSNSSQRSQSPRRSFSSDGHQQGPPPYSIIGDSGTDMGGPGSRLSDQSAAPGQVRPPPRGESSRGAPHNGLPFRPNPNPNQSPTSFAPGQIIPPQRTGSSGSHYHQQMGGMPPRNAMSPPPMNGMNGSPRGMMSPPPMNGMPGMGPRPPQGGPPFGPGQMIGQMPPHQYPMGGPAPQSPNQPMPPFANPGRPPSDPSFQGGVRKAPSLHSLQTPQPPFGQPPRSAPPVPNMPSGFNGGPGMNYGPGPGPSRVGSMMSENGGRPMLPSAALPRVATARPSFGMDDSPPNSPTERGPVQSSSILGPVKCKVFLQQQHAQWKALGAAKIMLYEQRPTMIKQLVAEADNKDKTILISTIVLSDGVERVGKTGVAVTLSDNGVRTGIVYMIQLKNEKDAGRFYESLLKDSDRSY